MTQSVITIGRTKTKRATVDGEKGIVMVVRFFLLSAVFCG